MELNVLLPPIAAPLEIRHLQETDRGWSVAETTHFRVFHTSRNEIVERVVTLAEETKANAQRKWFDGQTPHWPRRLAIRLYPDVDTYVQATGWPALRPGYASIRTEDARMVSGEINMHIDNGHYLSSVLPHEVTHAVVGSNFSRTPRWADEGMAMLSESEKHLSDYLRAVSTFKRDRKLLPLTDVIQRKEYPNDEEQRLVFYCQSVSLVVLLTELRSAKTFIQFVRDSYRQGYAAAFRQNYGFQDFQELEASWIQSVARKKRKR